MRLIGTEGGFLDGLVVPKGVVYNNTAAMPLVLRQRSARTSLSTSRR